MATPHPALSEGSTHDLRNLLRRDYAPFPIPCNAPSEEVRAGDGDLRGIRGWILAYGLLDPTPFELPSQRVVGHLELRYPLLASISHRIEGFDAGSGGAFFVPWPFVSLRLQRHADEPSPDDRAEWSAAASFFPVLPEDPAPPGLESVLYGRRVLSLANSGTLVHVPDGATEYRVMPACHFPKGKRLTVLEQSANVTWAQYTIDPNEPYASGAAAGQDAWKQTPPRPGAAIHLQHDASGERNATVYWRYDLGTIR